MKVHPTPTNPGSWSFSAAAIVGDMAAPTLVTDGDPTGGKVMLNYGIRAMANITSCTLTLYVWDGTYWSWLQRTPLVSEAQSDEADVSNYTRFYLRVHDMVVGAGPTCKTAYQLG